MTTYFHFFFSLEKHEAMDAHAVMLTGWKHEWPTLLSTCPSDNSKSLLV